MKADIANHKARIKAELDAQKQGKENKVHSDISQQKQHTHLSERYAGNPGNAHGTIEDLHRQKLDKLDILSNVEYKKKTADLDKRYEKVHFGEFGGRMAAREAAFGSSDPEVVKHKEQEKTRLEKQQKLQQEKERSDKLKEKGYMSQVFNRSAKQQQLEKSVQEKKAEGISKDFNKAADNQRMHQQNKEIKR